MNTPQSDIFGTALRAFFSDYLPQLRGMSSHTILSYRDSLKLFIQFLIQKKNLSVKELSAENIGSDEVIDFLEHLEKERKNGSGTRNIRLSAIHCFFRYLAGVSPQHLNQCQQILSIPFKRTSTRNIEYLEFEEFRTVLESIDRSKSNGLRDYALLLLMFNTGARVQEIVDLKVNDLCLSKPYKVYIFGKGRKERICPIWSETAQILNDYVEKQKISLRKNNPIFLNHMGQPLTRFGVGYILKKYLKKAVANKPSLKNKRLHPHSIRHSTAVHLLKSGVDLSSIANWMGHESPNTTNKYAVMDLEMKQKAIDKAKPLGEQIRVEPLWRENPDLLDWLDSL